MKIKIKKSAQLIRTDHLNLIQIKKKEIVIHCARVHTLNVHANHRVTFGSAGHKRKIQLLKFSKTW